MILRATTAPGLEDVAAAEIGRLLSEAGLSFVPAGRAGSRNEFDLFGLPGVVSWRREDESAAPLLRANPLAGARSLFHVALHVAELEWDGRTLSSLLAALREVDLDEARRASSFRVSCSRVGEHDFQSPEVERATGSLVQERYGTAVDLEHYELHVKIDVVGARALCGYQLTRRKGLDRRYEWRYHPRVTLRTPIAYGMLVLAGFAERPGALHDPFCGSGTILLEAASLCRERGVRVPLGGSDIDAKAVEGATLNVEANVPDADITLTHLDARDLTAAPDDARPPTLRPGSLRYLVTNPPFGIRLGRRSNFQSLYRGLLEAAVVLLEPGGTLALLVGKRRGVFQRVLQGFPELRMREIRAVEMGGVYALLVVLERSEIRSALVGAGALEV